MANFNLDFNSAFSTGWEITKKQGLLVAVIFFGVGVVSSGLQNIMGSSIDVTTYKEMIEAMTSGDTEGMARLSQGINNGGSMIGSWIGALLQVIVSVGLYNLALGLYSGKFQSIDFNAFKLPFVTYLKVIAVSILVGIATFVSLFFCIVPFFLVAPRLQFAAIYMVENPEVGVFDAIVASWKMTEDNLLPMIGLGFAFAGIAIVGLMACCIGVYFTDAFILFTTVAAYLQLKGNIPPSTYMKA